MSHRAAVSIVLGLLGVSALGAQPEIQKLQLVDDLGRDIAGPLEVCLLHGLERKCQTYRCGDRLTSGSFDAVTVEGPDHGPITASRRDLKIAADAYRLTVLRKATLRIRGLPLGGQAGLTLFRKDDADFRQPSLQQQLTGDETRIPAGELVLSISRRGLAPDLHLITAPPGGSVVVDVQSKAGWSLLLRSRAEVTHEPVDEASVEILAVPGYGDTKAPPLATRTDHFGLVVFSGLTQPIARGAVTAPGFVERQIAGLSASPGTFAFHEVTLERPGSIRATITLAGRPAAGVSCKVETLTPPNRPTRQQGLSKVLFEGKASSEGICLAPGIPEGQYVLRFQPDPEPAHQARQATAAGLEAVRVVAGQETDVEVKLEPIAVGGTVYRGRKPAPDHRIRISRQNSGSGRDEVVSVITDEGGEYHAVLWAEGEYFITLMSPSGRFAEVRRVTADASGVVRDFHLAEYEVRGVVTDEKGQPVADAGVGIGWTPNTARAQADPLTFSLDDGSAPRSTAASLRTDEQGRFDSPLEEMDGVVRLQAGKDGFRSSKAMEIAVSEETPPSPVVLVLTKEDVLAGILVSAHGEPVAGAWIAAYEEVPTEAMLEQLRTVQTGSDGHFEVPRARGPVTRLFVSGPGCPLRTFALPTGSVGAEPLTLGCGAAPAGLELTLLDQDGGPLAQRGIALRRGAEVFPWEVVAAHLGLLGLPAVTDGSGRLALVGLEPGDYELYLADASNPTTIAAGLPYGHLTAVSLAPLATAELAVNLDPQ